MVRRYRTRWENQAVCTRVDPEAFFEVENARDEERMEDPMVISMAIHACETCSLIDRCFREAVFSRSMGIWGGTTAAERGLRYR
jgi:Transcription factor WhiB